MQCPNCQCENCQRARQWARECRARILDQLEKLEQAEQDGKNGGSPSGKVSALRMPHGLAMALRLKRFLRGILFGKPV